MSKLRNIIRGKALYFMLVMLLVPISLTFYAWHITKENVYEAKQAKFGTLVKESEKALLHRIDSYKQALLGGKGFFEGSQSVERSEWKAYVDAADVLNNFPGINGIGIINDVPYEDLENFIEDARNDGYPEFKVHPKGKYSENFVIKYIEPLDINMQAVGLNIGFEKNRREAAIKSRDTGNPAITRRILLVQDREKTPGFLLLLPSYDKTLPSNTVEERRKAFLRWVYAPFVGKNFMMELTDSQGKILDLKVYDGKSEDPNSLIYDSNAYPEEDFNPEFVFKKRISVMQQDWFLVWSSTPLFERIESSNEPLLILITGLLFTGLLAVFMLIMGINAGHSQITLRSYIIPVSAFAITALAIIYLYKEISLKERNFVANVVKEASESISDSISKNTNSLIRALGRMAERWTIREGIPFKEWQKDAKRYLRDQQGLKAVEWVDSTYHVRWVEPLRSNEKAVGLNILFNKEREDALKGAAKKNDVTITPPLDLVQGYKAFISYSPVRVNEKFGGFIVGIFGIRDVVSASLSGASKTDFIIQLFHNDSLFYASESNVREPVNETWVAEQNVTIADKEWKIRIFPKPSFIKEHTSFLPDLILVVGLVMALMVALIINFAQRSKQKTELLKEKENLLSTFVMHTPAAVAMFDEEVRYIAASNRWYKDYGLLDIDIIGKSHYEIFPEILENHPEWPSMHKRVINGEVIKVSEEAFIRADGKTEWIRYELRPWSKSSGKKGGLIMFTENITERKQMEIMKDEFISTVNHELRTPLTSIEGSLGLLQIKAKDKLDEKGRRLLELSYDNCTRLTHLVNDILDMEKIAAGKMEYTLKEVEISSLVEEIIEHNQSYAEKYSVRFVLDIKDRDVFCKIDSNRFTQALSNLLSNAAKFSPKNDIVKITVRLKSRNKVCVSVADNGSGIPKDFQKKIFSKFAQADSSSKRAKGGTGLGLNITKSIIEAFNGKVTFDSQEGKGTIFHFILPVYKPKKQRKNKDDRSS